MNKIVVLVSVVVMTLFFLYKMIFDEPFKNRENFNNSFENTAKALSDIPNVEHKNEHLGPLVPATNILDTIETISENMGAKGNENKCDYDLTDYVLKSTVPPVQKCPSCICPKVTIENCGN